jgi:ATP-dependent Lhr-like helicase
VETTLGSRTLCLVQMAGKDSVFIIDALELADLAPLADLLGDPTVEKLIHNASFERSVFERLGIAIENVTDTIHLSKAARGVKVAGGHSLKAVCVRELGIELDKVQQTSDWTRRPLTRRQLAYAALDAEVLLAVADALDEPGVKDT